MGESPLVRPLSWSLRSRHARPLRACALPHLCAAVAAACSSDFAGDESSCGIVREHLAYCWGSNAEGRLGNGYPPERSQFLPTVVISGPAFTWLDVGRVEARLVP
jgi:hypothetical protein